LQIDVEKLQERPDLNAEHEAMRRRFTLIAQRVVETASKRNGGVELVSLPVPRRNQDEHSHHIFGR